MKNKLLYFIFLILFLLLFFLFIFLKKDGFNFILKNNNYNYDLIKKSIASDNIKSLSLEEKFNKDFNLNNKINIIELVSDEYFKSERISEYISFYLNNNNMSIRDVVESVNSNNNLDFYTLDNEANIDKNNLVLVNKYYKLNNDYIPTNLITIESKYGYGKMKKEAYVSFIDMYNAAKKDGYNILITSAYRSFKYQKSIYNKYVKLDGKKLADTYSARAGYSEHQTGLAVDLSSKNSYYVNFEKTNEYNWMINNSYKYGFILRYPEGKENVTGYKFEAWHYRYVGKTAAKYIYDHKIVFDEYYEYFLN